MDDGDPAFDCSRVTDGGRVFLKERTSLGGHPIQHDNFGYGVQRIDGVVHLLGAAAFFVPPAFPGLDETMTSCATFRRDQAIAAARATTFTAHRLAHCQEAPTVSYTPQPNDTVDFEPAETWSWQERVDAVQVTGSRTVRITVDPANYTPELLGSGARCQAEGSDDFTVTFEAGFDIHTGHFLFAIPGPCDAC